MDIAILILLFIDYGIAQFILQTLISRAIFYFLPVLKTYKMLIRSLCVKTTVLSTFKFTY